MSVAVYWCPDCRAWFESDHNVRRDDLAAPLYPGEAKTEMAPFSARDAFFRVLNMEQRTGDSPV